MRFTSQRHRPTPTIIVVALIDILIVLLIFLIVTTTFKQQPALKLALPESRQPQQGAAENAPLLITIAKVEPHFYLGPNPVTLDKLRDDLKSRIGQNPQLFLTIRADTDAPWGKIVNVMDAAKDAGVKPNHVNALTRSPGKP